MWYRHWLQQVEYFVDRLWRRQGHLRWLRFQHGDVPLAATADRASAVSAAAATGTAIAVAAPTVDAVGAAAVLPHCAGGKHGLRRAR